MAVSIFPQKIIVPIPDQSRLSAGLSGLGGLEKYKTLNLSSLTISGTMSATHITGITIDATQITSGNIATIHLAANTLAALQGSISNLSAINANVGSITAGSLNAVTITGSTITGNTITGGVVQTASSGARVRMIGGDPACITFYAWGGATPVSLWSNTNQKLAVTGALGVAGSVDCFSLYVSGAINCSAGLTVGSGSVVGGTFRNRNVAQIDAYSWAPTSYSLIVSNNIGTGYALADGWNTYSEFTEIEPISLKYQLPDEELPTAVAVKISHQYEEKIKNLESSPWSISISELKEKGEHLRSKDISNELFEEVSKKRITQLEAGTLLAISIGGAVPTNTRGQTNVLGVISDDPGFTGGVEKEGVPVTKFGNSKVFVVGKCNVGDLLQSSDSEGCAEKAPENPKIGTIIGRAKVNKTYDDKGLVDVSVALM